MSVGCEEREFLEWADLVALAVYGAVGICGMAMMGFALVRTHEALRRRGANPAVAGLVAMVAAMLMLIGGWLIVVIYVATRWVRRHLRPSRVVAATNP